MYETNTKSLIRRFNAAKKKPAKKISNPRISKLLQLKCKY